MPEAQVAPQPVPQPEHHRLRIFVGAAIAAFVLLLVSLYGSYSFLMGDAMSSAPAPLEQATATSESAQATPTTPAPAVSADVQEATPAVNPVEATNPFNEDYENPFQ